MKIAGKEKLAAVLRSGNVRLWNRYVRQCRRLNPEWRANLSGADLRNSDLNNSDLRGANLSGADLRGANLRNSDLNNSDLRGANLRGADLNNSDLRGADLRGAELDFASWPLWCGGTMVKIGTRTSLQLIYHAFNQDHDGSEIRAAIEPLRHLAERFRAEFRDDAPALRK